MQNHLAVEVALYRNATLISIPRTDLIYWPGDNQLMSRVPVDPGGDYRILLSPPGFGSPEADAIGQQYDGWTFARMSLAINGGHLPHKPVAWYTAEPTDWASGIARWALPAQQTDKSQPIAPAGPCTYTATIRRPS